MSIDSQGLHRNDSHEQLYLDRSDHSENSIEVSHVSKRFRVYLDRGNTLKELTLFKSRRSFEDRTVLKDISFTVRKGEAVGLIGHNGCGKSTTLKLLTRIIYPDSGTITMRGRVSSLIELGAGFHPDMSGRENIYINASIFGLSKKEIDEKLDTIIDFSELQEFIDNPVRTYSSGMYMRLAFAVAINVNADILLIDEILAVGDANFQQKCFNKMREIKASGTTIVLVSHSMGQIEQLCDRTIWINDGGIRMEGRTKDVDMAYLDFMGEKRRDQIEKEAGRLKAKEEEERRDRERLERQREEQERNGKRYGNRAAEVTEVQFVTKDGKDIHVIDTGTPCDIIVKYRVNNTVEDAVFGIGIFRNDGLECYGTNTRIAHMDEFSLTRDGEYRFHIKNLNLVPASYYLNVAIEWGIGNPVDYYKEVLQFEVISKYRDTGVTTMGHDFELRI